MVEKKEKATVSQCGRPLSTRIRVRPFTRSFSVVVEVEASPNNLRRPAGGGEQKTLHEFGCDRHSVELMVPKI